jgi:predicted component of type VI protein secretion system
MQEQIDRITKLTEQGKQLTALRTKLDEREKFMRLIDFSEQVAKNTPEQTLKLLNRYLEESFTELEKEFRRLENE